MESEVQGVEHVNQDAMPSKITVASLPEVERHLVKLLLDFGNENVPQEVTGEDGKKQIEEYTVAEFIIAEMRRDDLSLTHPLCQRVFEQCALMVDMTHQVDAKHFINSSDSQLRTFAATLMMDTYSLSDTWRAKGIFVPKLEENLQQDITESLYTFKSNRLAHMIAERREQLHTADEDRQRELLAEIKQLTDISRQMRQACNIVIAPHSDSY